VSKKLIKSFGYKGLHIIVLILYSLFLVPILLNYWDLEVYGAWIALYAFFNLIQVVELGHGVFVGNEFNRIVHTQKEAAKKLIGSALRANLIVGFFQLALIFSLYKLGLFRYLLDESINDFEISLVLYILFFYRMTIGSFRGIIVRIFNPFGLIYKSFQFSLIEKVLEFFILISAAIYGVSLIELAMLWFLIKFLYSITILIQIKKTLPEYFPWWQYGSFSEGLKNLKKSLFYASSYFLDRLGNDGIVLIVSAIVGSSSLPLFSATRTLVNFGLKLSEFFLKPLGPEMINFYSRNQKSKIIDIFKSYWFASISILIVGFAVSMFFIEDLFTFWTRGKLEFNFILFCALALILVLNVYGKAMVAFFTGINKINIVLLTSVIRISLFFTIAFIFKDYGLNGVLLGMFFSELLVVTFWLPFNTFKIFSFNNLEKVNFFVYLFAVFCLGIIFYCKYLDLPLWLFLISFTMIIFFGYYQYKLISIESRNIILSQFKKIIKIFRKRKN